MTSVLDTQVEESESDASSDALLYNMCHGQAHIHGCMHCHHKLPHPWLHALFSSRVTNRTISYIGRGDVWGPHAVWVPLYA